MGEECRSEIAALNNLSNQDNYNGTGARKYFSGSYQIDPLHKLFCC
jgi:hypothetical protein